MIYFDPTETSSNTRLSKSVVQAGKNLDNLERLTGADILVTPFGKKLSAPLDLDEDAVSVVGGISRGQTDREIAKETGVSFPTIIKARKLWVACQQGILIQRKSGTDFTSSIPKLHEIFGRMRLWTPDPWLLVSANIGCNRHGKAVIDGKESGFTHKQLVGIKMSWSLSGGNVIEISRDGLVGHVLEYADSKLKKLQEEDTKFVVRHKWTRQNIVGANDPRWQWMQVLVDLPGIGSKKARAIAEYCGTLANSLEFLTDPNYKEYDGYPTVVNPSDIEKNRNLMGLPEGNKLGQIPLEMEKQK
jgi:hypothetical protein